MYEERLADIPQGTKSITLSCEWQYRINDGFIQVTFDAYPGYYEMVYCKPSFASKAYNEGTTLSKLAKRAFTKEALQYISDNNITLVDLEGESGDHLICAELNSDS